jgi:hypothetical protein
MLVHLIFFVNKDTERHRAGSMIFTSDRGPDEWLVMFADPMRAQSAIDSAHGQRLRLDHRGGVLSATTQTARLTAADTFLVRRCKRLEAQTGQHAEH